MVGALLLYFCRRYVMVLATAYAGALAAALGVGTFLPGQHVDAVQLVNNPTLARCVEWQCHLMAGAWVLLGTLGLIVQLLMFERPLTEAEIVEKARLVINGDAASVDSAGPAPRTKSSKSASKARGPAISYEELMHENKRLKAAMTRI